tara:strand:+ start:392 stop:649 length:258 start_codon:yes stop_codon:yes gene_type:complete
MTKQTDKKWINYHATRLNLIDSLNSHIQSMNKVNVYNNGSRTDIPLNTTGDYILTNESMGLNLISQLISKLTKDGDQKREYKDAV